MDKSIIWILATSAIFGFILILNSANNLALSPTEISTDLRIINFFTHYYPGDIVYSKTYLVYEGALLYGVDVYDTEGGSSSYPRTICSNNRLKLYNSSLTEAFSEYPFFSSDNCKTIDYFPKICLNPNGENGSYIDHTNFEYNMGGFKWYTLPDKDHKVNIGNQLVKFRVKIPADCNPIYAINKAIQIQ